MPDWITDQQPYEPPLEAVEPDYEKLAPSGGESFGAQIQDSGPTVWTQRAIERGQQEGASDWDRTLASDFNVSGHAFAQQKTPVLSAEEANRDYAPPGQTITDKPIEQGMAQVLGKQMTDKLQREGILSRYAENTGGVQRFGTGVAAFLMDPLNLGTTFIPGIGEEAIGARLGYASLHEAPLLARLGARVGAGAISGVAAQAPLTALRYGVGQEEGNDYSLRQAALDLAFSGGIAAALHGGVGAFGDLFKARATRISPADPVVEAPPATRYAATNTAVSQIVEGRMVDVKPVFDEAGLQSTTDAAVARPRTKRGVEAGEPAAPEEWRNQALADVDEYRGGVSAKGDILQAIRNLGGLKVRDADGAATPGPDIQGAIEDFKNKPPGVINNENGLTPERMHEALAERGWFGAKNEDPEALVTAIRQQAAGDRVYHPQSGAPELADRRSPIEQDIGAAGVQPSDSREVAAQKVAQYRFEGAQATDRMDALRQRADTLGVSHTSATSHDELLADVIEREAIQGEGNAAGHADHEREITTELARGLTAADLKRLDDLASDGLGPEHGEGASPFEFPEGGRPVATEGAARGEHAEGSAGGGEGAARTAERRIEGGQLFQGVRAGADRERVSSEYWTGNLAEAKMYARREGPGGFIRIARKEDFPDSVNTEDSHVSALDIGGRGGPHQIPHELVPEGDVRPVDEWDSSGKSGFFRKAVSNDIRAPYQPATDSELADLAKEQQRIYENGFAPGIPQDEFDQTNEEIYGKAEDEEKPKPLAEKNAAGETLSPEQAALADLESQWQRMSTVAHGLLPEEQAELHATSEAVVRADQDAAGYEQAGNCLTGAGV